MEPQEIFAQITATFKTIIQKRNLHPTQLAIELNEYDNVEIYMVAPEFSRMTDTERHTMLWSALEKRLPQEVLMHIGACVLLSPEEERGEFPEEESTQQAKLSMWRDMTPQEILAKATAVFKEIIRELNLHPTLFEIELTIAETLHVYLIAPEFSGKTERERDLMIWPVLENKLPGRVLMDISVCMLLAPEEKVKMEELRAV
jgi:stress-induced morphogen